MKPQHKKKHPWRGLLFGRKREPKATPSKTVTPKLPEKSK
jgi:hypothetical protein